MAEAVREAIDRELGQLSEAQQQRVLDFVRSLAANGSSSNTRESWLRFAGMLTPEEAEEWLRAIDESRGAPGRVLTRFAGSLSQQEAEAMMRVIAEECERIDEPS